MSYSMIAAVGRNGEIGINNKLPWDIPEDMKRFREVTRGHTVIMGRKTHESIGRPLPNRTNIVISMDPEYKAQGCVVVNSVEDALLRSKNDGEVFVIGGGHIYEAALPYVDRIYLTEINADFSADTYFPKFDRNEWKLSGESSVGHRTEREPIIGFSFVTYERTRR